jgi:transposase
VRGGRTSSSRSVSTIRCNINGNNRNGLFSRHSQNAEDLWTKYIQLMEAEAAFRALKSELTIRPVSHQLERRVKAHVLIAFLGYALWVTLKHQLRRRGTGLSPTQALAQLATLQSADIALPTTNGREIRLRRVGRHAGAAATP